MISGLHALRSRPFKAAANQTQPRPVSAGCRPRPLLPSRIPRGPERAFAACGATHLVKTRFTPSKRLASLEAMMAAIAKGQGALEGTRWFGGQQLQDQRPCARAGSCRAAWAAALQVCRPLDLTEWMSGVGARGARGNRTLRGGSRSVPCQRRGDFKQRDLPSRERRL
jgi:hypothetical protein